jgi:3-hydroxyisobutyrate dehydrogenase-like beta-hydroxyacid dehydrogenase
MVFNLVPFGDTIMAKREIGDAADTERVSMDKNPIRRIAVIGFGEVGGIFGSDFAAAGIPVSTFDILLNAEPTRSAMLAKAKRANVSAHGTLADAVQFADLVISAVTASSAMDAAASAASLLRAAQIYLDLNSVSPDTKRQIAHTLGESPAVFVEAAVMAPVSPLRIKVPMLLGGPQAAAAAENLQRIGMNAKPISDQIGVASAIKMCRSIIIKGLEAITVESIGRCRCGPGAFNGAGNGAAPGLARANNRRFFVERRQRR